MALELNIPITISPGKAEKDLKSFESKRIIAEEKLQEKLRSIQQTETVKTDAKIDSMRRIAVEKMHNQRLASEQRALQKSQAYHNSWSKNVSNAVDRVAASLKAMIVLYGTTKLYQFLKQSVQQTIDFAGEMTDLADQMGITYNQFYNLTTVAEKAGIRVTQLGFIFRALEDATGKSGVALYDYFTQLIEGTAEIPKGLGMIERQLLRFRKFSIVDRGVTDEAIINVMGVADSIEELGQTWRDIMLKTLGAPGVMNNVTKAIESFATQLKKINWETVANGIVLLIRLLGWLGKSFENLMNTITGLTKFVLIGMTSNIKQIIDQITVMKATKIINPLILALNLLLKDILKLSKPAQALVNIFSRIEYLPISASTWLKYMQWFTKLIAPFSRLLAIIGKFAVIFTIAQGIFRIGDGLSKARNIGELFLFGVLRPILKFFTDIVDIIPGINLGKKLDEWIGFADATKAARDNLEAIAAIPKVDLGLNPTAITKQPGGVGAPDWVKLTTPKVKDFSNFINKIKEQNKELENAKVIYNDMLAKPKWWVKELGGLSAYNRALEEQGKLIGKEVIEKEVIEKEVIEKELSAIEVFREELKKGKEELAGFAEIYADLLARPDYWMSMFPSLEAYFEKLHELKEELRLSSATPLPFSKARLPVITTNVPLAPSKAKPAESMWFTNLLGPKHLESLQKYDKQIQITIASMEGMQDVMGSIAELSQTYTRNQIDATQAIIDAESLRWQIESENLRNSGLENTAYYKNKQKASEEMIKKEQAHLKALQHKAWEQKKKADIIDAGMNIALAITKAFSQTGILGFITGAFIAAAGAVQIGMLEAQRNPYARGGLIPGQGFQDNVPINVTPGEYVVNRQSTEQNKAALDYINKGGVINPSGNSSNIIVNVGNMFGNIQDFAKAVGNEIFRQQQKLNFAPGYR